MTTGHIPFDEWYAERLSEVHGILILPAHPEPVEGPAHPEPVARPNLSALGLDDPEGRN